MEEAIWWTLVCDHMFSVFPVQRQLLLYSDAQILKGDSGDIWAVYNFFMERSGKGGSDLFFPVINGRSERLKAVSGEVQTGF